MTSAKRHKKDTWQFIAILLILFIFAYYESYGISSDSFLSDIQKKVFYPEFLIIFK